MHLDFSKNIGDNVTEWKYKENKAKKKTKAKTNPHPPIGTNRDRLPIVSSGCFVSCLKNRKNEPRKDNDRTQPLEQTQVSTC